MRGAGSGGVACGSATWDHPRACGEQAAVSSSSCSLAGSSPRMRGAGDIMPPSFTCLRIIPAHAGSREISSRSESAMQDHPRACGEQLNGALEDMSGRGSSPRMRGAGRPLRPRPARRRIIPAHAGSSTPRIRPIPHNRDHPRACGEQARAPRSCHSLMGSSPRMRGAGRR